MFNKVLLIIFVIFVAITCQKKKVPLEFGGVSGHVIDGSTGADLEGVTITAVDAIEYTGATDASGNYNIASIHAAPHTLRASLTDYDSQDLDLVITKNETLPTQDFVLLPSNYARGKVVIVLTWAQSPSDLDTHLFIPDGGPFAHLYYGNLGDTTLTTAPFASIDLDDVTGTGPETTTIKLTGTDPYYSGVYRFVVHNYSGEFGDTPLTESVAIVRVFMDGVMKQTYRVPTTGSGIYWHVFDLNGTTFTEVNTLSDDMPAYP